MSSDKNKAMKGAYHRSNLRKLHNMEEKISEMREGASSGRLTDFYLAAAIAALLMVCLMIFSEIAHAHPADDFESAGGLQVKKWHLGLFDSEFAALHKSYWHERRLLDHAINKLTECRGWRRGIGNPTTGEFNRQIETLAIYWDNFTTNTSEGVIPAHPVIDSVNMVVKCSLGTFVVESQSEVFQAWRSCKGQGTRTIGFEGNKSYAQGQIQAAKDTTNIANALLGICESGGNF